jgi:hypothetical protein
MKKSPIEPLPAVPIDRFVRQYEDARENLIDAKWGAFPIGTPVLVDCPQYSGPGIITQEANTPPNKVAVRLENGNVWWYPILSVVPNSISPTHGSDIKKP